MISCKVTKEYEHKLWFGDDNILGIYKACTTTFYVLCGQGSAVVQYSLAYLGIGSLGLTRARLLARLSF